MIPPVRPIELSDIEAARRNVAGTVLRTPLVRLDLGTEGPDIRLKLENLQPTNAYKIRGAANAVARLSEEDRARGVWTISAGNAGQGVAYAARAAGIPCSVVAIETAPQTKLDRMVKDSAQPLPNLPRHVRRASLYLANVRSNGRRSKRANGESIELRQMVPQARLYLASIILSPLLALGLIFHPLVFQLPKR